MSLHCIDRHGRRGRRRRRCRSCMVHGLGGTTNTWTPLMRRRSAGSQGAFESTCRARADRTKPTHCATTRPTRASVDRHARRCGAACLRRAWRREGALRRAIRSARSSASTSRHVRSRASAAAGAVRRAACAARTRRGTALRAAGRQRARAEGMFGIADAIVQGRAFGHDAQQLPGGRGIRARVAASAGPRRLRTGPAKRWRQRSRQRSSRSGCRRCSLQATKTLSRRRSVCTSTWRAALPHAHGRRRWRAAATG